MPADRTPTTELLAEAMEAEELPDEIIVEARRGLFDDFHEHGHPTPQMYLAGLLAMLPHPGAEALRRRVINGEFDAQKWESDAWAAKQTGEMGAIIDKLGLRDAR